LFIATKIADPFFATCEAHGLNPNFVASHLVTEHSFVLDVELVKPWKRLYSSNCRDLRISRNAAETIRDLSVLYDCSKQAILTALIQQHLPVLQFSLVVYPVLEKLADKKFRPCVGIYIDIYETLSNLAKREGVSRTKLAKDIFVSLDRDTVLAVARSEKFQSYSKQVHDNATVMNLPESFYLSLREAKDRYKANMVTLASFILLQEFESIASIDLKSEWRDFLWDSSS